MTKGSKRSEGHKFWSDHIKAWPKSGLSQTDYCKRHNLSRQCFYQWKAKIKANRLIPVKIVPSHSDLWTSQYLP